MGYGIGPQMESILQYYWYHLSIVARSGRYYGTLLKIHEGVTYGDTLSPTIFNMVEDAVIWHWVTLLSGEEEVPDGFGWSFQLPVACFYADNGIIALPRTDRLQEVLDVLMELFDRVGLQTNVKKMVGMVCQPCYMDVSHSEAE